MKLRVAFLVVSGVWAVGVWQAAVKADQAPAATRSVVDGVYTEAQARRGAETYSASCSSCHGGDLGGDGFAPPLAGGEFASNWNGLTVGDLFDRIRISMPPEGPNSVPPDAKADIVAYLLSVGKYPAGAAELEPKVDVLKQIKIEQKQ